MRRALLAAAAALTLATAAASASPVPPPVTAAIHGDGLRVNWPGPGRACIFRARDGQPLICTSSPWRQVSRDVGLLVAVGEIVEVRRFDGGVIGRATVRAVAYLPAVRR